MTYFQVKPEFDGKRLYKKRGDRGYSEGCKIPNGFELIGHELLTQKEVEKRNVPLNCIKAVKVKRGNTYKFFGARFEAGYALNLFL